MTCLKYFNILGFFDRFRRPILFYSNNSTRPSTKFGLFISFSIYAIAIYSFSNSDIIQRKNPKTLDQEVETNNRPEILLSHIIFSIENDSGVAFIDPTIFTLKVNFGYYRKANNRINGYNLIYSIEEELRLCREDDFELGAYASLAFENRFCFKNRSLVVSGFWDEREVKYFYVSLVRCDNQSRNNTCKSDEEIDKFFSIFKWSNGTFNQKYMQIYVLNNFVDLNDQRKAIKSSWRTDYNLIDVNTYKSWKLFFKKVEFTEDENLPFSSSLLLETYSYEKKETDLVVQQRAPILFMLNFYSSNIVHKKARIYQSVPEALANLWGLLGLLTVIGLILTEPMFNLELIQLIFRERKFYNERKVDGSKSYMSEYSWQKNKTVNETRGRLGVKTGNCNSSSVFFESSFEGLGNKTAKGNSFGFKFKGLRPNYNFEMESLSKIPEDKAKSDVYSEPSLAEEDSREKIFRTPNEFPYQKYKENCLHFLKSKDHLELGGNSREPQNILLEDQKERTLAVDKIFSSTDGLKDVVFTKKSPGTKKETNGNRNNIFRKIKLLLIGGCLNKHPAEKSFFPFTLFEFFRLGVKELFRLNLSARETIFKQILKTHKRELNISILLQRVFLLEKQMEEVLLTFRGNTDSNLRNRKFSVFDILND